MKPHWLLPDEPITSLAQYREATGADAVAKARAMAPEDIIAALETSGLRGRGGAGFPTGRKWRAIFEHPCEHRSVVCNAAEGEPGTFKDRFLIRKHPYPLFEGMLIAAHVVGATKLYIAAKASFERELEILERVQQEFAKAGLLDGLELAIYRGPEEYLYGEEKALLNAIEGMGPLPREAHYPPYVRGLYAKPNSPNPALVNNVESFARVPGIVVHGPDSFRALGTHDTPGTLLFTVCGDVQRPGVYEAEAGITLNELFNTIAGGPRKGRRFVGTISGVASGPLRAEQFDTPAEFGALQAAGGGLGSAGLIVFDDATNVARVAQSIARFLYVESCSQCSACKMGLRRASEGIDQLFDDEPDSERDIEWTVSGAKSAPQQNRCYLPVQGAEVIPAFFDRFPDVFARHAAGQGGPSEPYPIPKIVDYHEETHTFTYDPKQALKQEDWSYATAPHPAEPSTARD